MFYIIIGLPYLSSKHFSKSYISFISIRIILVALLLSLGTGIILSVLQVIEYIKKRRQRSQRNKLELKIVPADSDHLQDNEDNKLKVPDSGRCEVSFASVMPYNDDLFERSEVSFASVMPYSDDLSDYQN